VTPLWRRGLRGQGQTIAVVSFASFDPRDIEAFDRRTGTSGPRIERVPVNGGTSDVTSGNAREVALDLQVVRGIAPKARILNYEAPYTGLSSFATGIGAALDAIVRDGRADIVSISYGACDVATTRTGFPFLPEADRMRAELAIQAAVARGVSVFVATQDQGAYACQLTDLADHRLATSWPGNSPGVISVGGTLLSVDEGGAYLEEAGWEDVISIGGGGGGLNPRSPMPSWQRGRGVMNAFTTGARQVPDVAAAADPESGFLVYFEGRPGVIGGTSAATPFWAGAMTLVRQLAARQGVGRLGFVAPMLYELARTPAPAPAFHDVTRGGNRYYDAAPGWDYSTGLGSPRVWSLAQETVAFLRARAGG
jgi:kumamolisin